MEESVRMAGLEGEAPVNPYTLLEAVNDTSDTGHTSWLIFLGIMSYLLIAVAGVTHKDLLLSSDIQLPILQVKIDLLRFFLFAPIALVLFHLGLMVQLALLASKALEFDYAIRMLESGFATADDIDLGMVHGCAHPLGPLALTDLIGLDTTMAVAESMYSEFKEPLYAPPPLLCRMVEAGLLGRKTGRGFHSYAKKA